MSTLIETVAPSGTSVARPRADSYHLPLGYLRAFLTLLVLFHHATLAYYPLRPPVAVSLIQHPRWWSAFPVVDKVQWGGFLFTILFNDIYLMPLFFLLSGLFAWKSLQRHGILQFLRERLLRLGVPLAFFTLLTPIAYYPAYLQSRTHDGFWHEWLGLGDWPCGPLWFMGVLLAFNVLLAGIFRFAPAALEGFSRQLSRISNPLALTALLVVISCAAYLPLALNFNLYEVFAWGPFFVHKSRVLLYLVFFLFGVALGAGGLQNGLLHSGSRLAKQWAGWLMAAPGCFVLLQGVRFLSHRFWSPRAWAIAIAVCFTLSCVSSCVAALALSLRFVRTKRPVLDSLAACAYGIYLVHYYFVPWLQYGALSFTAPALMKAALVFSVVVALSWGLVHSLRKIPIIARLV